MRIRLSLPLLFLCCCVVTTAAAQTNDDPLTKKVDQLFATWDKPESPGAAIAVIKDGAVVYKRGYGSANLEYNIPVTPQTVFHVASVSKQFTAFAITLLANQGKLSLDDDIRKHLPEVPDFGKKITIRHLIHHTSGLRDQWTLLGMAGWRLDDVITKEHIMKMVRHQKELNFDPGAENLYSNTGYTLLAVIVERVSGQSFREYTEANIFKPLGMTNTHFHDDHERIVKNRAYSYMPAGAVGGFRAAPLNYANVGATSLFTTADDLARWVINFEDKKIGGADVIKQMHQQGVLNSGKEINYAFGLSIGPYRGLNTVGHAGGDAAYRSFAFWFPDQRFAVVVLSNFGSLNPQQMAQRIADIYLADKLTPEPPKTATAERKAVKVDPGILESYAGRYLLDGRTLVVISKEGDKLMGQPGNSPKAELIPQSETTFFVKEANSEVTFERDEKGNVVRFAMKSGTQSQSAKRLNPPATAAQLTQFAGDYYSPELGTGYSLVVKDGKLIAQHRRHDDISLTELDGDLFSGNRWFFQTVQFTRDSEKRITGFRLTSGRVRNLRFDRQ
ncbi:MAG TPA: serine hydrolase [Pyrinomonadaceae bacterium]|nr:serine hydrolase [Pyrinomonadaceae bacterium]